MTYKWRCTVCGYIHEGSEPPDLCPVCGVGSDRFVPVQIRQVGLLQEMKQTFQPHAVMAHFPNALLPILVLFQVIAFVTGKGTFEAAAFYLLVITLVMAPLTLVTGLHDWKTRFNGQTAAIFRKKKILGATLITLALCTVSLRTSHPGIAEDGSWLRGLYFLLTVAMLGCVALLGHYGGKLVFSLMGKDKDW